VLRLLYGDVRRAVVDRHPLAFGLVDFHRVGFVALEAVDVQRLVVAKEVVEGSILLVKHDDVSNPILRRARREGSSQK